MFNFILDANDETFHWLVQTNSQCENILKWYFLISFGSYFLIIPVFAIISVFSNYYMAIDFDPVNFYRPYQLT